MNNRQFYSKMLAAESAPTLRVLNALPESALGYRPHERSRTASEIAWVVASELHGLAEVLATGNHTAPGSAPSGGKSAMIDSYKSGFEAVKKVVDSMPDDKWETEGVIDFGGGMTWKDTLSGFAWGYLNDSIHHRGQLSTYLRPMGGKVPSIYGPSADDTGMGG